MKNEVNPIQDIHNFINVLIENGSKPSRMLISEYKFKELLKSANCKTKKQLFENYRKQYPNDPIFKIRVVKPVR